MLSSRFRYELVAFTTAILAALGAVPSASAQRARGPYTDVRALPDGPVGERITELLDTINANDPARTTKFVTERFTDPFRNFAPMDAHLSVFADLYNESRGLEFYAIRKYEEKTPPTEAVVIVRNKLTQGWLALVLNVDADPPHRLAGLQVAPARPPTDLPPSPKLSDQEIVKELDAFVKRLADADAFSGAVLLAKNGEVLFKGAYGLASKSFNVPNRVDTKFNLGSMNKMFTCVAVLQLVQAGKLALGDPLAKFVSEDWLPRAITEKVRIKHLMTHTSGLGSYFNDKYEQSSRALFRELDDYKPLIEGETLAFEPGTKWQYSNTGMFLLGVVIEKASGENFFDYIREHIYKPAGMVNSDCYDMDRPVANLAIGYSREHGKNGTEWVNNLYKHVIRGGPAGGGFSTVEDLLAFDRALRGHKLLNPEYTQLVWSAKPELNSPEYGFGFGVREFGGELVVGHGGGFPGISANLDMFLTSGYTAAVMSNYDQGAEPFNQKIRELVGRRN